MRKIAVSILAAGQALGYAPPAMSCADIGPFHFEVTQKTEASSGTRGAPLGNESPKLKFAGIVDKDATRIQSDAPFLMFTSPDGKMMSWGIDLDADTRLSAEYSMLEVKDFIKKASGIDIPLTDDNLRAMQGTILANALNHPDSLEEPLSQILGSKKAFETVEKIKERKRNTEVAGLPHFTRASFLSSKSAVDKFGYNTTAYCMSMAFGRDRYSNPDEGIREYLASLPAYTLRSSLVDHLAAIYTKEDPKKPVSLLNGRLKCELKPSEHFKLEPIAVRCPAKIVQTGPVVRGVYSEKEATQSFRYIQIGDTLYTAVCQTNGKAINLSEMPDIDPDNAQRQITTLDDLLLETGENLESDKAIAKEIKKLGSGQVDIFAGEYVKSAAAVCDSFLTNGPKAAGQSSPAAEKASIEHAK